jgi:hypothetical protein
LQVFIHEFAADVITRKPSRVVLKFMNIMDLWRVGDVVAEAREGMLDGAIIPKGISNN